MTRRVYRFATSASLVFEMSAPRAKWGTSEALGRAVTIATPPGVSVLVVDAAPDHRCLAQRRLQVAGFEVRVARNSDEALAVADGGDLVLLDHRLPGTSGLDLLPVIADRGPSVVMVTGMGSEGLAVEAMRRGAVDYIVKDESYLDVLAEVLSRAWLHHDLVRRAGELERIGLMVTSASARPEVFAEVVEGARSLLRADGCILFVLADNGLAQEATAGRHLGDRAQLLNEAHRLIANPDFPPQGDDRLL